MLQTIELRGIKVYPFTSEAELLNYVDERKGLLVALNAEKVLHSKDEMRNIINRNIGYCDGAGVELALKKKGIKNACKIAGCELWLKIIERWAGEKSFYFVGAKQEVIDEVIIKLKKDFPNINILGYRNGFIKTAEEKTELIEEIASLKPDVVFVAMGSPKQELLMEEMMTQHPKAIYQGLGGSFDVYTGKVLRAPQWWIDHKLEFAYRLIKEPKRIKRQIHLVKYFWWLITNQL